MPAPLLTIDGLTLACPDPSDGGGWREVLRQVTCEVAPGEVLGLVGGIGAGKTMLLQAVAGQLPAGTRWVSGSVELIPGPERSLHRLPAWMWRDLWRRRLAWLGRDVAAPWHPGLTMRRQLGEIVAAGARARELARESDWLPVLCETGLIEPESLLGRLPGELSDSILQRFAIGAGLLRGADVWIADEPTSALDATGEDQILRLLRELCARHRFGLLLATHHFGVIGRVADRVAVLFEGAVVETGPVARVLSQPAHRYTRALLDCLPRLGERRPRLGQVDRIAEREALLE